MAERWTAKRIDEIERRVVAKAPDLDGMTDDEVYAWLDSLPHEEAAVVLVRSKEMEDRERAQTGES